MAEGRVRKTVSSSPMKMKIVGKEVSTTDQSEDTDSVPIIEYVEEFEYVCTPPSTPGGRPDYQRVVHRTLSFEDALKEGVVKIADWAKKPVSKEPSPKKPSPKMASPKKPSRKEPQLKCEKKCKEPGWRRVTKGCKCVGCKIQYENPPETFGGLLVTDYFEGNPDAKMVLIPENC